MSTFSSITPTLSEVSKILPGDDIIANADVTMDCAFTLPGQPKEVWPWIIQLGKNRAGWYFPRNIECFIFPKKRALRSIDPNLQDLRIGSVIDDWGGKDATFEVAILEPRSVLVYKSQRGSTFISWSIVVTPHTSNTTRIHLRLRLAPVKYKLLAKYGGGLLDALTVAGLAAGLRERLAKPT